MNRRNFLKSACAAAVAGLVSESPRDDLPLSLSYAGWDTCPTAAVNYTSGRGYCFKECDHLLSRINTAMRRAGSADVYSIDENWTKGRAIVRTTVDRQHWPAGGFNYFLPEKMIVSLPENESETRDHLRAILRRIELGSTEWCLVLNGGTVDFNTFCYAVQRAEHPDCWTNKPTIFDLGLFAIAPHG